MCKITHCLAKKSGTVVLKKHNGVITPRLSASVSDFEDEFEDEILWRVFVKMDNSLYSFVKCLYLCKSKRLQPWPIYRYCQACVAVCLYHTEF